MHYDFSHITFSHNGWLHASSICFTTHTKTDCQYAVSMTTIDTGNTCRHSSLRLLGLFYYYTTVLLNDLFSSDWTFEKRCSKRGDIYRESQVYPLRCFIASSQLYVALNCQALKYYLFHLRK